MMRKGRNAMRSAGVDARNGAPERIRTSDLCLRRAALYPAELVKQREFNRLDDSSFPQIVPNVQRFNPLCDQSVTGEDFGLMIVWRHIGKSVAFCLLNSWLGLIFSLVSVWRDWSG